MTKRIFKRKCCTSPVNWNCVRTIESTMQQSWSPLITNNPVNGKTKLLKFLDCDFFTNLRTTDCWRHSLKIFHRNIKCYLGREISKTSFQKQWQTRYIFSDLKKQLTHEQRLIKVADKDSRLKMQFQEAVQVFNGNFRNVFSRVTLQGITVFRY